MHTSYAGVVGYTYNAMRVVGYSSNFTCTSRPMPGKKKNCSQKSIKYVKHVIVCEFDQNCKDVSLA